MLSNPDRRMFLPDAGDINLPKRHTIDDKSMLASSAERVGFEQLRLSRLTALLSLLSPTVKPTMTKHDLN